MRTSKSEIVIRSQRRKKEIAVQRFGGKCCICGYNKCIGSLDFHHLNKNDKNEKPCYIIIRWSWERIKKELEKCILVCSNCHREIHYTNINTNLRKYKKPWITKICSQCKEIFDTKEHKQVCCSNSCAGMNRRRVNKPNRKDLKKLLDQKITWTKLGKMFGVSDNGVRKWAKKYELI